MATPHIIYVHQTVPGPPEEVWAVITDVARADQVLRSVKESELLTQGPYDVGTAWREKRTVFGHHGEEELHVTESRPPRHTIVETRLGPDVIRTAYSLTPTTGGEPGTRLGLTTTIDMADRSPLGTLAWRYFGEFSYDMTHRMLQHDLEDVAAEVARRRETRQPV